MDVTNVPVEEHALLLRELIDVRVKHPVRNQVLTNMIAVCLERLAGFTTQRQDEWYKLLVHHEQERCAIVLVRDVEFIHVPTLTLHLQPSIDVGDQILFVAFNQSGRIAQYGEVFSFDCFVDVDREQDTVDQESLIWILSQKLTVITRTGHIATGCGCVGN